MFGVSLNPGENLYFQLNQAETLNGLGKKHNFSIKNTIESAHGNSVFALSYSPDEKYLWSGGRDALLKIWDLEKNCEQIFSEPAHWFTINAIVFSPDGKFAATASRDKTIKIWA